MKLIAIRSVIAASLLMIGVTIGGFGSAAAQPDYGVLPVNPNEVTDSTAYVAAAPGAAPARPPPE